MAGTKMLGKYEKNCPWGCCSDYGHGKQDESRRRARRQEVNDIRKTWNVRDQGLIRDLEHLDANYNTI